MGLIIYQLVVDFFHHHVILWKEPDIHQVRNWPMPRLPCRIFSHRAAFSDVARPMVCGQYPYLISGG